MARTSWGTPKQAKEIGTRLRTIREERDISQRKLSVPGISPAYISRIEGGDRMPSLNVIRILAERLDVSPDWLETGSEPARTPEQEVERLRAEVEKAQAEMIDRVRKAADVFGYDLVPRD